MSVWRKHAHSSKDIHAPRQEDMAQATTSDVACGLHERHRIEEKKDSNA